VHEVTELLLSWRQGDTAALDRLIPFVYDELRRVARRHLRGESPGHALQATALVHEVYLRLVDVDRMTVTSRSHFFGVAATLMRQILVDHARRRHADKRGGRATMVSLDGVSPAALPPSVDVLALDQALGALSVIDDRQCRVVELRFFAGLNIDETAEALGVSPTTVEREWALAKAWLFRQLSSHPRDGLDPEGQD
jgi:RNA polymerase sigma factor (TIGR02999 family)